MKNIKLVCIAIQEMAMTLKIRRHMSKDGGRILLASRRSRRSNAVCQLVRR